MKQIFPTNHKTTQSDCNAFTVNVRPFLLTCVASLGLLILPGCGAHPEAEFQTREEVEELARPAKKTVEEMLAAKFGTPNKMVAWPLLPINYGGEAGSVVADKEPDYDTDSMFKIALGEPAEGVEPKEIPAGSKLQFLSGKNLGKSTHVTDYEIENNLISYDPQDLEVVSPGDQFVINPGGNLHSGQKLYLEHCMHCHGITGDGNGPTAKYLNPRPRDYRNGIFKFTSTTGKDKAQRDDLGRIVRLGIPGTYMPSFMLLEDEELEAIVEYIRWLAMRGEYELKMAEELAGAGYTEKDLKKAIDEFQAKAKASETELDPASHPDEKLKTYLAGRFLKSVEESAEFLAEDWARADEPSSIVTPLTPRNQLSDGLVTWLQDNKNNFLVAEFVEATEDGAATAGGYEEVGASKEDIESLGTNERNYAFKIKITSGPKAIPADEVLTLVSGKNAGKTLKVADYSPETGMIFLVGDRIAADLKKGDKLRRDPTDMPPVFGYLAENKITLSGLVGKLDEGGEDGSASVIDYLNEESIKRGRALFVDKSIKCADCHGVTGRGDGPQTEAFEKVAGSDQLKDEPGLHDMWNNPIQPRNLTRGIYRGGRRPVDVYRRIHSSIKGTPMPASSTGLLVAGENGTHDYKIWDLVNYVMSIPYEKNPRVEVHK